MHRLHTVTLPDGTTAKKPTSGKIYTHVVIAHVLPVDHATGQPLTFDRSRAMYHVVHWCGDHARARAAAKRAAAPSHVLMTDVLPVTMTVQGQ